MRFLKCAIAMGNAGQCRVRSGMRRPPRAGPCGVGIGCEDYPAHSTSTGRFSECPASPCTIPPLLHSDPPRGLLYITHGHISHSTQVREHADSKPRLLLFAGLGCVAGGAGGDMHLIKSKLEGHMVHGSAPFSTLNWICILVGHLGWQCRRPGRIWNQ